MITGNYDLLSAIVDNTIDSIVAADEEGVVLLFNRAAEQLFGYIKKEVIGKSLSMLLPNREGAAHGQYMADYLKSGRSVIMGKERELFGRHKNGTVFPIGITINELKQNGTRYFTAIVRDISERKYLEESLLKTKEEAETANRKKSLFLANISHDIRTPMNGVIGMAELLLNTEQTKEQEHYTRIIISSGELLLSLINDLLDISKMESLEHVELNPTNVSLHQAIEDIKNSFMTQAAKNHVTLKTEIDTRLPEYIVIDALRFSQILVNLVGNAIKFTKYGTVIIRVTNKGMLDNDVTFVVEVEDSGIGIPEDKQDIIFNKFTQAEKHTSSQYGGTGLGLAISKGLVQEMGGHIGVKSQVGEGSTFWFQLTIPIGTKPKNDPQQVEAAHKLGEKFSGRILVAEDFPANQEVMRNILQKLGCEVVVVEDGHQVLEALEKAEYDLLLLDCIMPNMDGYEAAKAIRVREQGSKAHLPIIAVTASTLEEDQRHCMESGMDGFIHKPVSLAKIREVLGRWL
jgi:PAS domain S-box-containing protein